MKPRSTYNFSGAAKFKAIYDFLYIHRVHCVIDNTYFGLSIESLRKGINDGLKFLCFNWSDEVEKYIKLRTVMTTRICDLGLEIKFRPEDNYDSPPITTRLPKALHLLGKECEIISIIQGPIPVATQPTTPQDQIPSLVEAPLKIISDGILLNEINEFLSDNKRKLYVKLGVKIPVEELEKVRERLRQYREDEFCRADYEVLVDKIKIIKY